MVTTSSLELQISITINSCTGISTVERLPVTGLARVSLAKLERHAFRKSGDVRYVRPSARSGPRNGTELARVSLENVKAWLGRKSGDVRYLLIEN